METAAQAEQVVIVGAGPAGIAAAIQLARLGVRTLLLERAQPGGLLSSAALVENYPGFPSGVSGPALARMFVEQALRFGATPIPAEVTSLARTERGFRVATAAGVYTSQIVLIASGTDPRRLPALSLFAGMEDRVVHDVRPLLAAEGKRIAIVGAGDAAFDYALNLSMKNEIQILNRGTRRRCLPLLWERSRAVPSISYRPETSIIGASRSGLGRIALECSGPAGPIRIEVDYLLAALGRDPSLSFVAPELMEKAAELEQRGLLHFAGDVKNGDCRQAAVAVGDGVRAATRIRLVLEGGLA